MDNMFMNLPPDESVLASGTIPVPNGVILQPKKATTKRPPKKSNSAAKMRDDLDSSALGEDGELMPPAAKKAVPGSKAKSNNPSGGPSSSKKKKVPPKPSANQLQNAAGLASDHANSSPFGRWKAEDDYALITAVQQTCDLTAVYLGVRFTSKFSLREIQERWYTLLYDPIVSKLAKTAIQALPLEVICRIERETLFSHSEEEKLCAVASNNQIAPPAEIFDRLIRDNPGVFHPSRSAYILLRHWQRLRRYHMLNEQQNEPNHEVELPEPFSDAEEELLAQQNGPGAKIEENMMGYSSIVINQRRKKIRRLENETNMLNAVAEPIVGITTSDFHQPQTYAVLRGRAVRYLMRSPEITIGRNPSSPSSPSSSASEVQVDLSLEGPAWRVSRRQAIITMKSAGEFYIENIGRSTIVVDSKPILPASGQVRLHDNVVLEIGGCLHFVFLINPDLSSQQQQQPNMHQMPSQPLQHPLSQQQPQPPQMGNLMQHQQQPPQQQMHPSLQQPQQQPQMQPHPSNPNQMPGNIVITGNPDSYGVSMHNQQSYVMTNAGPGTSSLVGVNSQAPTQAQAMMPVAPPNISMGGQQFVHPQQQASLPQQQQQQPRPVFQQHPSSHMQAQHGSQMHFSPQTGPQSFPPQQHPGHHFSPPVGSPTMMAPNTYMNAPQSYRMVAPQQQQQAPSQAGPQFQSVNIHPQQMQHMQQQQHPH